MATVVLWAIVQASWTAPTLNCLHVILDIVSTVCVYCTLNVHSQSLFIYIMYITCTMNVLLIVHLLFIYCTLYYTLYCTWNVHDYLMSCAYNVRAMHIRCTFTVQLTTTCALPFREPLTTSNVTINLCYALSYLILSFLYMCGFVLSFSLFVTLLYILKRYSYI